MLQPLNRLTLMHDQQKKLQHVKNLSVNGRTLIANFTLDILYSLAQFQSSENLYKLYTNVRVRRNHCTSVHFG